jgi:hypothetical protein
MANTTTKASPIQLIAPPINLGIARNEGVFTAIRQPMASCHARVKGESYETSAKEPDAMIDQEYDATKAATRTIFILRRQDHAFPITPTAMMMAG